MITYTEKKKGMKTPNPVTWPDKKGLGETESSVIPRLNSQESWNSHFGVQWRKAYLGLLNVDYSLSSEIAML